MALFVYVSEACRKEAEENGFQHALESFRERVETAQDTGYFDPFPPPYLVKKQFGGRQGRLIAAREVVTHAGEVHIVIVFLSVMIRGEYAYNKEFGQDPATYGDRFFANRYRPSDLSEYVANRLASQPVIPKPAPSEAEYEYLYQALSSNETQGTEIICESTDWVLRTQSEPFKGALVRLYDALTMVTPSSDSGGTIFDVPNKPGWRVLVRAIPTFNAWFLVAPLSGESSDEERNIRQKYAPILEHDIVGRQTLLQYSRRSYPQIILADEDLWIKIQQDRLGNLALSPEETDILKTAMRPEGSFPLFINGRAGSGKSTILQYLFTDYLYYHLTSGKLDEPPVYFTCNPELLQEARKVVRSLLECSAKYWDCADRATVISNAEILLQNAFKEFRGYLLSLISSEEKSKIFFPTQRVDYAKFRKLYYKKFGRDIRTFRDYSPDLCWHIIRTYIKGTSPDTYLDPDEYMQIEQKQRSVSQESYAWVFSNVWERWYREISQEYGYWDDQDLVRYVLENGLLCPAYPGIFCDEAQDFTRVELEAILRMNLFSARAVSPTDISHIPFVFAGDQFQTINPTGFRWDSVRAWFVEKFIFALDPTRKSGLDDFHYHDLSFNYRSTAPVVGFSNHVQALRSRLFSIPGLKPQVPWDTDPASPVTYFESSDGRFWEGLKSLGDVVFVLPCHEGEELDMLSEDYILKEHLPLQDGVPSIPVLSAARAKGLEFPRVVVYGFGHDCPNTLLDPIRKPDYAGFSSEEALPLEYYVNRLYVAVSRPKRQLIIVDDRDGMNKLWEFATNLEWEGLILDGIRNGREIWDKRLTRLEVGRPEHLTTTDPINVLENAQQLERDGRNRSDSYMLRQAAVSYKNAGEDHKAILCRAEAEQIDGEYLSAGDLFLNIGLVDEAVSCYWMAKDKGWQKIITASNIYSTIVGRIEYAFADFLIGRKNIPLGISIIERFSSTVDNLTSNSAEMNMSFGRAIDEIITRAFTQSETTDVLPWAGLYNNVFKIREAGVSVSVSVLAQIAFRAKQYSIACSWWEKLGQTTSAEYKRARAESEPYPQRILSLYALGEWSRVTEEYFAHSCEVLQSEYESSVGVAFGHQKKFDEAIIHLVRGKSRNHLKNVAELAFSAKEYETSNLCKKGHLVLAVESGDWPAIIEAIKMERQDSDTILTLGRALGRSDSLTNLPSDAKANLPSQKLFSEFLRSHFIKIDVGKIRENNVLEIGAAIERSGNRVDALQFYEAVEKASFSQDTKQSASIRWVVCKERQAKYDADRGDSRNSRDRMKEAEDRRRRLNLSNDIQLPEFPSLSTSDLFYEIMAQESSISIVNKSPVLSISEVAPVAESLQRDAKNEETIPVINNKTEINIDPYRITFFYEHGRINIEHVQSGETLSIRSFGSQFEGDWTVLEPVEGKREVIGANFCIIQVQNKKERSIHLEFPTLSTTLVFTF